MNDRDKKLLLLDGVVFALTMYALTFFMCLF